MGFNYSTAFELTGVNSAREQGEGARGNSGWEGYGKWERKGRVSGENMGKLHNKAQYLAIEKGLKGRKSRQGAGAGNVS